MAKRRGRAGRTQSIGMSERKLRTYCEKLKRLGESPGSKQILLAVGASRAAVKTTDPMALALLEYATARSGFFLAGTALAFAEGPQPKPEKDADALIKLIEGFYKLADDVRIALKSVLSGTRITTAAWWGARLEMSAAASQSLQDLVASFPDLGAVLTLMFVSRTATLVYVVVSASGKLLAKRLHDRTSERGVALVVYFYAIPFVDKVT